MIKYIKRRCFQLFCYLKYVFCVYLKCKMILMMECSLALVHLINIYYLGPGNQLLAPRFLCLKLAFISNIIYLERCKITLSINLGVNCTLYYSISQ